MLWSNIVLPKAMGLNDVSSTVANLFRGTVHLLVKWAEYPIIPEKSIPSHLEETTGPD